MPTKPTTIQDYLNDIPEERKAPFEKLRNIILENIPEGFDERMSYKMLGYVVPHSIFPAGYHCDPKLPLPFINLANQKGFIALYHMGIYADEKIYTWFVEEYKKVSKYKLDMGKSCIRFKKMEDIPYNLIAELMRKFTPQQWIDLYQKSFTTKK
jgi:uncharacterized protein YdhG (YjbR/CyaY superfamily)